MTEEQGRWLPLGEAAQALGLSTDAVKRRMTAGLLQSRQERRPQGYRWLVLVEPPAQQTLTGEVIDEQLQAEISFLRDQVRELTTLLKREQEQRLQEQERRHTEVRELHTLVARTVEQLAPPANAALEAAPQPPPDPPDQSSGDTPLEPQLILQQDGATETPHYSWFQRVGRWLWGQPHDIKPTPLRREYAVLRTGVLNWAAVPIVPRGT